MTETTAIRVTLNGSARTLAAGDSVAGLLRELKVHPGLVVVERNGEILRRESYPDVRVEDGDTLELVHFVGGG
jgi:thiamine biosynthesis protein ThiS